MEKKMKKMKKPRTKKNNENEKKNQKNQKNSKKIYNDSKDTPVQIFSSLFQLVVFGIASYIFYLKTPQTSHFLTF